MTDPLDTSGLFKLMLRPETGLELTSTQWQEAILVLREAKVLGSLYHSAVRAGCYDAYPVYAQRHIHSAHIYALRQAVQIEYEAKQLKQLLDQIDVTAIFLKGAAYTLKGSKNGLGRICTDLDLLVDRSDLSKAEAHLKSNRWHSETLSDYDEKYYREWAHEVPPLLQINRGTVLDLHHNIYPPISGRAPTVERFFESRESTHSGCFVLDPASMILHSTVHMFTNEDSASWMRDLLDIIVLLQEFGDDQTWSKLLLLARDTKFTAELAYCLGAVKYYSDIALPKKALKFIQSQRSSWIKRWLMDSVFINAVVPEHESLKGFKNRMAKQVVYFRGHWIKMPLPILIKHFTIKFFLAIRDKLVGKYHFDPKQPQNLN